MTADPDLEPLIAAADAAVQEALRYFEGPGATAQGKVDQWGPKEVLSHFLFWHEATVQGIEALSAGGQPLQMSRHVDEINAEAVDDRAGADFGGLVAEARELQARLVRAAQRATDANATVVVRADGTRQSVRQRLKVIAHHWAEHISELRAAGDA